MKTKTICFMIGMLLSTACKMVPVYLSDYRASMGGSNDVVTLSRGNLAAGAGGITGFQTGATPSAVIFTDESGRQQVVYSSRNTITIYHKENWEKQRGSRRLAIDRYFYQPESNASRILRYVLAIPTLGYSLLFSGESYTSTLLLYNPMIAAGMLDTDTRARQAMTGLFLSGKIFNNILLDVRSTGDSAMRSEFYLTDSLPDFMTVVDVSYYTSGDIKQIVHQVHQKGDQQVIALKVTPGSKGLKVRDKLQIKIAFKVNGARLYSEKYREREILHVGH